MITNKTPITALLAAVPYLLLSTSQSVTFTTIVERDGSGLRQFAASCLDDRVREVRKRIREASPHFDVESRRVSSGQTIFIRNWRPAGLDNPPDRDISLQITDIAQQPLSIFTDYQWSEKLEIYRQTATEVETEGEQLAVLHYVLQMPGTILPHTLSAGGRVENGQAVWELTGDKDEYTLEAHSRQVRWGYLLILIYILAFVIFQIVSYVEQRIKNRPRKI